MEWGIWQILTRALEGLKDFHFNGLLLSKVYIIWAKKVWRSYLSWNWREIQNLERIQLLYTCCFKIGVMNLTNCNLSTQILTRAQILTWSLKDFHFNGLLLSKVCIVWAKKVQRGYLSWHWRVMKKNLRKTDLLLAKWQKFCKFSPQHSKVSKLELW